PPFGPPALLVMLAVWTPGVARAWPSDVGVRVAEGGRCSVSLVALSYDDPGADDAEFVELHVEGVAAPTDAGTSAGDDAGDASTGPGPLTPLTLADCGLATIE